MSNHLLTDSHLAEFVSALNDCESVEDVLRVLEPAMRVHGICRLRYYRHSDFRNVFYAVESLGHTERVAEQFRAAPFEKRLDANPLDSSESFWCFELDSPVILYVSPDGSRPLRIDAPGEGLPAVAIPVSRNATLFAECINTEKNDFWIDIPLSIGAHFVGKFSCDLTYELDGPNGAKSEEKRKELLRFASLAQIAAPHLEFWRSQNITAPLKFAEHTISQSLNSSDILTDAIQVMCGESLLNCTFADILVHVKDSLGGSKLVLAATNYPTMWSRVYFDYYCTFADSTCPTVWVHSTGDTIRLSNMLDAENRQNQLRYYSAKLTWKHKVPLCRRHRSLMIVAIPSKTPGAPPVGVLRFAEKKGLKGKLAGFTARDQKLAERFAQKHLEARLHALWQDETLANTSARLSAFAALERRVAGPEFTELYRALGDTFMESMPQSSREGQRKKKLLVSKLQQQDRNRFELVSVADSECPLNFSTDDRVFDLKGTLTSHVIASDSPVLFSDLRAAETQCIYKPIVEDAKSILSARIGHKGEIFGVMSIVSSHFDLSLERYGSTIQMLADRAGELISRQFGAGVASTFSGIRHDIGKLLTTIEVKLARSRGETNEDDEHLSAVIECLQDFVDAHCRSGPLAPELFCLQCFPVNIKEMLLQIHHVLQQIDEEECEFDFKQIDDGLSCRVHHSLYRVCLLNLMRNAIAHRLPGTRPRIGVEVTEGWLITMVRNAATPENAAAAKAALSASAFLIADDGDEVSPKSRGVRNVKLMARLHQTELARWGHVRLVDEPGGDVVVELRIPIVSFS